MNCRLLLMSWTSLASCRDAEIGWDIAVTVEQEPKMSPNTMPDTMSEVMACMTGTREALEMAA
jgi:hypothetical protein